MTSRAQGVAYANCMRKHGVTSFPDPNGKGAIHLAGIDPTSPVFQAARNACRKLSPKGTPPTAAQQAQQQQALLAFSRCMRAHGITDFPDPTNSGHFQLDGGPGSDLTPNNPQFARAQNVCGRGHVSIGNGTVRIR